MLQNHSLGIYEKAFPSDISWKMRLQWAKELGFDFLEISIDETDERIERLYWNRKKQREFLDTVKESGIEIRSMCLSAHRRFPFGSNDKEIRRKAREIMSRAIDFASYTGIRIIQLAGYDVYYEESTEESRNHFLEGLVWACKEAERSSVMLAMEIMDTPFINSITKNKWYVENLKSPWYGVYPDLGNLTAWGNNVKEELETGIGCIVAVHLKDTLAVTDNFPGKFKSVEFGTGCVDFPNAFLFLEKAGYTGPYLIEMWHKEGNDYLLEIKRAKLFIEEQYRKGIMSLGEEERDEILFGN